MALGKMFNLRAVHNYTGLCQIVPLAFHQTLDAISPHIVGIVNKIRPNALAKEFHRHCIRVITAQTRVRKQGQLALIK